jgi:hypothetical protein
MIFNKWFILLLPVLWQLSTAHKVAEESGNPGCKSYYNTLLKKHVFTQVEVEPEFPGGAAQYQRLLFKNLRFLPGEIDSFDLPSMSSSVIIKFVVDTDGQIKNSTVDDKDSTGDLSPLERATFRALKGMPKWKPGQCNGKVVPVELKRPLIVCFHPE